MSDRIEFVLEGKELKDAEKWIKKQKKKYPIELTTVGERFSYSFMPSGLGVFVSVHDAYTGKKKNVTDVNAW